MYALTLMLALFHAAPASAAVTIQPGQTITVGPGEAMQVTCAPAVAGSTGAIKAFTSSPVRTSSGGFTSGAFCFCKAVALQGSVDFNLVKVTLGASGERTETNLRNYVRQQDCDRAIANYPSCR